MYDPREHDPAGESFDPDATLWTPGIDYVAGWRDAEGAGRELADALRAAGGHFLCAFTALHDPDSRAYYDRCRDRGKTRRVAEGNFTPRLSQIRA